MNTRLLRIICCLLSLIFCNGLTTLAAQPETPISRLGISLQQPRLVAHFYRQNNDKIFWLVNDEVHIGLRKELLHCIDDAYKAGLPVQKYHRNILTKYIKEIPYNIPVLLAADDLFTDAALMLCKDIYTGVDIHKWVSYDGISQRYVDADNDFLVKGLAAITDSCDLHQFIEGLEPQTKAYAVLKTELSDCRKDANMPRIKQLITTLNYHRWIWHFPLDSFIVVDIGSTTLQYYKKDSLILLMKIVTGAPDKRTPRFAAYCSQVTLYPYWNMPHSIAVNEWLPSIKRDPRTLSRFHMDVIDQKGRIISPAAINWSKMNRQYFPYRIRQQTGCLNPMGVLKFTLTSPYDVYMHDTNFKGVFLSKRRYRSHGCIRLEQPIDLANALLPTPVDSSFLKACFSDQTPRVLTIPAPVPVFVVYMTATVDPEGKLEYHDDVYHLLK